MSYIDVEFDSGITDSLTIPTGTSNSKVYVTLKEAKEIAKKVANHFIERAANEAELDSKINSIYQGSFGNEEGRLYEDEEEWFINKQSILKLKKEI